MDKEKSIALASLGGWLRFTVLSSLTLGLPLAVQGATIFLGSISFDTLIPAGPGAPGVNDFSINDFSGNPSTGGFALPPDFPVYSSLVFTGSTLDLTPSTGGAHVIVSLGNLGPGSYNPITLDFADTRQFSSASFSATLGSTSLLLSDGTTFHAPSSQISALLQPSAGVNLAPGIDVSLISISDATSVPEPGSLFLAAGVIGAGLLVRKVRQLHFFRA